MRLLYLSGLIGLVALTRALRRPPAQPGIAEFCGVPPARPRRRASLNGMHPTEIVFDEYAG